MMGRIVIGLDIGQQAVRGVRISRGLGGLRVIDTFEAPVDRAAEADPFDWPRPEQIRAIQSLIHTGKLKPTDAISIALPAGLVSARRITLPFTQSEALRRALPYEMEAHLPFDASDVMIDFQLLQTTPESAAILWVSACPKTILNRCLSRLREIGIDPAGVGVDAFSLYALYRHFNPKSSQRDAAALADLAGLAGAEILMVDIGASKTTLCDIQQDIQWTRTLPMGGNAITEAIAATRHLPWEEAEKHKTGHGTDAVGVIACIQTALGPWLMEIEKSLRSEHPGKPAFYYLTGGGSALNGVDEIMTATLSMQPLPLHLPVSPLFAQGLGVALNGPAINFRQGEWANGAAPPKGRRAAVGRVLLALLFLAGLMVGDLALYAHQKEARYQESKTGLRRAFLELFPQARNAPDEVEHTRAQITKLSQIAGALSVGERSPLRVLNQIASAIPGPPVFIEVQAMTLDEETVRIEAQTDSYLSIDKIRDALMKLHFQDIKVSDAKVTADQSKVQFRVQISIRDPQRKGL